MNVEVNGDIQVEDAAVQLCMNILNNYDPEAGISHMSSSIYDTAWVAMISKIIDNRKQWLFPTCFQYILEKQIDGHGWESYPTTVDGVLNTAAVLLCLKAHSREPLQLIEMHPPNLLDRISGAESHLRGLLVDWRVDTTDQVGFEILVPAMLSLLEKDTVPFDFPGRQLLFNMRAKKVMKLDPELFYGSSTAIASAVHSLEGLIGHLDFDRLQHRTVHGSMMASPSSTAAYLMHTSTWDDDAEAYLRRVNTRNGGYSRGGVPSAYPSTHYELLWLLSTLIKAGINLKQRCPGITANFISLIQQGFEAGGNLLGFAPGIASDADDTAMAIFTFNKLGVFTSPRPFVEMFDTGSHFKTYSQERNPSLTTNCNALLALVTSPDSALFAKQILALTQFIILTWQDSNDRIKDKWNLSPYYLQMIMAQSLWYVLTYWDQGRLSFIPHDTIRSGVIMALFQILVRTLRCQALNGSWGDKESCEESSYALIVLKTLISLPCVQPFKSSVDVAIISAEIFLRNTEATMKKPERLWIEKVSFGSLPLSKAYLYAALHTNAGARHSFNGPTLQLFEIPDQKVTKFRSFFANLPMFSTAPPWFLTAALIEGYLLLPRLRVEVPNIFSRREMTEAKYLEYIPFTWAAANSLSMSYLSFNFVYQMNVLSVLNYQADEYMEGVVGKYFPNRLPEIRAAVDGIFHKIQPDESPQQNSGHAKTGVYATKSIEPEANAGQVYVEQALRNNTERDTSDDKISPQDSPSSLTLHACHKSNGDTYGSKSSLSSNPELSEVLTTLETFVFYIMHHPSIHHAGKLDRACLHYELRTFLLAHLSQIDDSNRAYTSSVSQDSDTRASSTRTSQALSLQLPDIPFSSWVRSIASDHTSCPYSFAFATCLLATRDTPSLFPFPNANYIARAACRHLATLCRMYNDYGSLARDCAEKNLNCVNFKDFGDGSGRLEASETTKLHSLMHLAEFERRCLKHAVNELYEQEGVGDLAQRFVKMFVHVTDSYGQIYVAQDIASRVTSKGL